MQNTCTHIALFTNDPEPLTGFYKKLGFKKQKESIVPKTVMYPLFGIDKDFKALILTYGEVNMEIFSVLRGKFRRQHANSVGYNHWALGVKGRDAFCNSLSRKKIRIIKAKKGGRLICFIKDPDGNMIELQELIKG